MSYDEEDDDECQDKTKEEVKASADPQDKKENQKDEGLKVETYIEGYKKDLVN